VVVLFHLFITAGSTAFSGGYVGVDVFFVISGFVITGVLLREFNVDRKIGLWAFYARRARRIIPAMALVIVVCLLAERLLLSAADTALVASDAKWSSVFLANFHFASVYPNFFVHRPDSPLQNYWSLAVEEQFYVVYPGIFLLTAVVVRRWPLRAKLYAVLVATVFASFFWFVATTTFDSLQYSPFARAWQLAIGGIVALGAVELKKIPPPVAAAMTWLGLGGILVAATLFTLTSSDPGLVAGLPTLSTALIIAGGTAAPRYGAELMLRLAPFKWIGRWSYSYYLWHWPILIVAALYWGHPTVARNLVLAAIGLVVAAITYFLVENPVRHSEFLKQSHAASLACGALLIASCFVLAWVVTV
jgi:peptidoglycan/LPS O-acetylase OafA/YrhL